MMTRFALQSLALLALLLAQPAEAAIGTVRLSPDTTLVLSGEIVADESLAEDDLSGAIALRDIGAIPPATGLAAYHLMENGDQLVVLETTVTLPGPLVARPNDVVRYDGAGYALEFSGSNYAALQGARIDALTVAENGDLVLSFDVTTSLPSVIADDEDLVRFDGVDQFELFFDGSAAGLAPGLDVDAAHFDTDSGRLLISLDGGGIAAGTVFGDEDLLEHDPIGDTWAIAYDGSAEHAAWAAADLVAAFVTLLGDLIFLDGFEDLAP
jgi:hypothetical protein